MIDCIVVNYRTPADLRKFIRSFEDTAPPDAFLTVVDVDPITPLDWSEVPGDYGVRYENDGYAAAVNSAAQTGENSILAIFNADVVLMEGTIEKCAKALENNDSWGIVGPLQYDSKKCVTHAGIFGTLDAPKHRGWKGSPEKYRDIQKAVTVSGSAYFIKRSVWSELTECPIYQESFPGVTGAFLPTFLYYEETFASYHAQAHGWDVIYYGEAECVHEWHGSIKTYGDRKTEAASRALFRRACDDHGIPRN